jgi:hypothetical protein
MLPVINSTVAAGDRTRDLPVVHQPHHPRQVHGLVRAQELLRQVDVEKEGLLRVANLDAVCVLVRVLVAATRVHGVML